MEKYVVKNDLKVSEQLVEFIESKALPGSGVEADAFWSGLSDVVHQMGPRNRALLEKRETIQAQIDA